MTRLTRIKLAFAAVGVLVFVLGIRLDLSVARMIGIACVAVAALLRLVREPSVPDSPQDPPIS